jgi:hypothetical protein
MSEMKSAKRMIAAVHVKVEPRRESNVSIWSNVGEM